MSSLLVQVNSRIWLEQVRIVLFTAIRVTKSIFYRKGVVWAINLPNLIWTLKNWS